jgi:hypothetical protein
MLFLVLVLVECCVLYVDDDVWGVITQKRKRKYTVNYTVKDKIYCDCDDS